MPDIYDQHKAAFPNVSAYVILRGSEKVATIAFKYPRDGSGRLYAYVHWLGVPMVRGFAGGYGYDKQSAAFDSAARNWKPDGGYRPESEEKAATLHRAIVEARDEARGERWSNTLERLGYRVLSVTG